MKIVCSCLVSLLIILTIFRSCHVECLDLEKRGELATMMTGLIRSVIGSSLSNKNDSVCGQILAEFGEQVSAFMSCSVFFARPFTMCENCEDLYTKIAIIYQKLKSSAENDSSRCEDLILNADKVRIVEQVNNFANQLWGQASCSYCFITTTDTKGRSINVLSNETVAFNELMDDTLECIRNNTNITNLGFLDVVALGNTSAACQICAEKYDQLNKFYNVLANPTDNLCMDIVDKMNSSRTLWSTKLECVHRTNPTLYVYVITGILVTMPILLYCLSWYCADRQERSIAPQKRLLADTGSCTVVS